MAIGRVHAAGPDETDEVQAAPRGAAAVADGRQEHRVPRERAIGDLGVDARQVLEDRPPGAEVEVADLAVAHLAHGQADGAAGRVEPAMRPRLEQGPPARHVGGSDGVDRRVRSETEAVDDDEHDGRGRSVREVMVVPLCLRGRPVGVRRQAVGGGIRRTSDAGERRAAPPGFRRGQAPGPGWRRSGRQP